MQQRFGRAAQARGVLAAQVFFGQGVGQHGQQHEGQGLAQETGVQRRDQPGAGQRSGKAAGRRRQQGGPAQRDAARILAGGHRRAADRGALVHAQQRGRMRSGKNRKQGRHQDQPAAAHDGIDKTGQQRGQRNHQQFHRRDCPIKKRWGCQRFAQTGFLWKGCLRDLELLFDVSSAPRIASSKARQQEGHYSALH
jgi:hypothetical protein